MRIPGDHLVKFVREIADQCMVSQTERKMRGDMFKNYMQYGAESQEKAAVYNKTYAYLDDLESLLYSPLSLRFHISDHDVPNVLEEAKGRAASAKLRTMARMSNTDSMVSRAVRVALVKGKGIMKTMFKDDEFDPVLVQPESMGVLHENYEKLDENMEAFSHRIWITPWQFKRIVARHPKRAELVRKIERKTLLTERDGPVDTGAQKQVVVGGLYPFQPSGSQTPNTQRGIVNWMGNPTAELAPQVKQKMLPMDEVWVWNDLRKDWNTFWIVDDLLIRGDLTLHNLFAFNPDTGQSYPGLVGHHPFTEFCVNPTDDYFWGCSEIPFVGLLQEAINSRLNGINGLLRLQEDPPQTFTGGAGINQAAYMKFKSPGGYHSESNPAFKHERAKIDIPQDMWASLHEYERMFDEMGGLPPIARGHGEAGVRSHNHAETLVRMFSPRFKDRALLVERCVESLGGQMLELARAHVAKKMIAWVPQQQAPEIDYAWATFLKPPVPGQVPVRFSFAELDEDVSLTVDSHSSSPAFSAEAKALVFDLVKIGAMGPVDAVEHLDAPDPEQLIPSIERREQQKLEAIKQGEIMQLAHKGHKKAG